MPLPDNIIQLPPEDLAPAANFASKFQGVNAAQRARYQQDQLNYAKALQQQQAAHMQQRFETDKDFRAAVIAQDRMRHAEELQPLKMEALRAKIGADYARVARETQEQLAKFNMRQAKEGDTAAMIKAINDDFTANGKNPSSHFTAINPGDFPHADKTNVVISDYMQNREKYLAPVTPQTQLAQNRLEAENSPAAKLGLLNQQLQQQGVPIPVTALFGSPAGAGQGGTVDSNGKFQPSKDVENQTHIQIPYINPKDGKTVQTVLPMTTFNQLKEQYQEPYNAAVGATTTTPATGEFPAIDTTAPVTPTATAAPKHLGVYNPATGEFE